MTRRRFLASALVLAAAGGFGLGTLPVPSAAADRTATVYKDPNCGCCTGHADHLRRHGFKVTVVETQTLDQVKKMAGIPEALQSCHTTMIDGYVVEGHVPMSAIDKLLAERPRIKGIALPGMPQGSPGMSGVKEEPFTTYTIAEQPQVFAVE